MLANLALPCVQASTPLVSLILTQSINMAPAVGIQSSAPDKVDESLLLVKGHNYYKDMFVPPSEEVSEIDPRDKVRAQLL